MVDRLEELITRAAPAPRREVDAGELWHQGVRRRRLRSVAAAGGVVVAVMVAAVVVQVPRERVEFADQPPRVAAVEAVLPEGGLVAGRVVDGVRVRTIVEGDDLCNQVVTPDTPQEGPDPFAHPAQGCTPVDWLPRIFEREGVVSLFSSAAGWRVFAGLVPDGYTGAVSPDGRQWEVIDNLLVIVAGPRGVGEAEGIPAEVDLIGPAGTRRIHVTDFPGAAPRG